ncbi:MAG: hypothetical protein EAZ08_02050 [Cytophagales bacterium]|nr:MAG: hypothetical protein EAZ08_02050 [Cytophagales bacterium]
MIYKTNENLMLKRYFYIIILHICKIFCFYTKFIPIMFYLLLIMDSLRKFFHDEISLKNKKTLIRKLKSKYRFSH